MAFERLESEVVHSGKMVRVRVDKVRHDDGDVTTREIVEHDGAVTIVAHDGEHVYLVEQPREAIDEPAFRELPAGKLDVEGEGPLEAAKRELAEEIGKGARNWRHLTSGYTSPGFLNEEFHIFLATDLYDESAEGDEHGRISVHKVPLTELDGAIRDCRDAKTLIGLLWLKTFQL
jgi:ADP-ribose pyrophosphatase